MVKRDHSIILVKDEQNLSYSNGCLSVDNSLNLRHNRFVEGTNKRLPYRCTSWCHYSGVWKGMMEGGTQLEVLLLKRRRHIKERNHTIPGYK